MPVASLTERILLVDDSATDLAVLSRLLDSEGYGICTARNGQEALQRLLQEPISLAILDVQMPEMDGLELLRRIRRKHGVLTLPVLMMSASAEEDDIVRAHDLGASDYMTKPCQPSIFLAKIRRHLATRQSLPQAPHFEVGSHLDSYELLEILGEGSMGRVFRARHLHTGRLVALKVLLTHRLLPEQLQRFQNEREAMTRISHPNVVTIFDVGDKPTPYLAMELVRGVGLDHPDFAGPQEPARAVRICLGILGALEAIHEQKIIHRDLKPANVMVTPEGVVKVMDFGVAKLLETDGSITESETRMGTPQFMSPEQIDTSFGAVSERSDLFAVAGILYLLLTGCEPFPASHPLQQLFAITNKEPIPPSQLQPGLPYGLESVCMLGLLKQPSLRFQSARDFAQALRDCRALED